MRQSLKTFHFPNKFFPAIAQFVFQFLLHRHRTSLTTLHHCLLSSSSLHDTSKLKSFFCITSFLSIEKFSLTAQLDVARESVRASIDQWKLMRITLNQNSIMFYYVTFMSYLTDTMRTLLMLFFFARCLFLWKILTRDDNYFSSPRTFKRWRWCVCDTLFVPSTSLT